VDTALVSVRLRRELRELNGATMATKPRCVSALGLMIVVVPQPDHELYSVVAFNTAGHWQSARYDMTLGRAKKERMALFRWHRKLAAERRAKRRKPAAGA
jgi:hypothetical protein